MDTARDIELHDNIARVQTLAAHTAESLDGAMHILIDLAESPDVPFSCKSSLYALHDVLAACRDRTDEISDLLDY